MYMGFEYKTFHSKLVKIKPLEEETPKKAE